jgi:hypothetical protein
MINKKYNIEKGQVSRLLLVLAIIVFVAVIISYIVIEMATPPPKPPPQEQEGSKITYEATLGDIKFTFQEAIDKGKVLKGSESKNPQWQKDLTTTEKFIVVTIGAQNKGKENIPERVWGIENIIDSEGRNFVPMEYDVGPWLPEPNLCGALLKPEFSPTPCTKIYEVSRISTGLKVEVTAFKKTSDNNYSSSEKDKEKALIDLIVTP